MADSDRDWRRWGETEPYFGVLADPRFRMAGLAEHRDAFFELGRLTVEERLATAEQHGGPFPRRRALDFGCGVGRLSLPLCAHFDEVTGLDIAPAMLSEARANADRLGIGNLRLALSDDALSNARGPFDFVMSVIVLQHIPVPRGMRLIACLLERVAPGGVAALQLCTGRPKTFGANLRSWAQGNVPGLHRLFNIARGRPWREPFMQMNAYSLDEVLALVASTGCEPELVQHYEDGRFTAAQLLLRRP